MLVMSPEEILQAAVEIDSMQRRLLQEFFLKNPDVIDFKLLADFPKSGVLTIDGGSWTYKKHGLGYSFASERGDVIDAHNHFCKTSRAIDAHRLTQYLASLKGKSGDEIEGLYSLLENGLKILEKARSTCPSRTGLRTDPNRPAPRRNPGFSITKST
ncbi:DUF6896 domain-containing protein [Variovorax sp. Root411]|uniref:DUF6896 domain-containing protein n=1 Tax=Variovorax sp. Root411 TaxID=1736530 RepID=UPI0012F835FC|nr:hypothetical protein [Variovorax sp. Root411]